MDIVCAWCKKDMGKKPSDEITEGLISHGICKECAESMMGPKKATLMEFLDSLTVPVLIAGDDVVMGYANK